MEKSNILIVGGGIGGLTLAVALKQQGIKCIVFEKAPQLSPVGSGILLSINTVKCLKYLGLADSLYKLGFRLNKGEMKTWRGKTMLSINYDKYIQQYGVTNIGITRGDLHQLLVNQLDENDIHLSKTFKHYEINADGSVTAHFVEGESYAGDILIGADGIHSKVLQQVNGGSPLRYHGSSSFRGLTNIPYQKDEPFLLGEYWGKGNRFGLLRVNLKQIYWFISYKMEANYHFADNVLLKKFIQEHFSDWVSPLPELVELTKPEHIIHVDLMDRKPLKQWYKGPVALLGDAIHSTTPNLGQGAGMAIESAIVLAHFIKHFDRETAFQKYFNARYQRTTWVNKKSDLIGKMGLWENPILCWLRNNLFYFIPQSMKEKQNQTLFSFDPGKLI
jgi:2-polyprenyl-6-methoxyphenol hydroxylase-like FAD-dependent oxidoreductase